MSISLSCPICGKNVKAPDSAAGKKGKCPNCGELVKIPGSVIKPAPVQITSQAVPIANNQTLTAPQIDRNKTSRSFEEESDMPEKVLYEQHPSMFRNNPIGFVVAVVLILAFGLGIVILLIWWLRCIGTTLTISNERTILRKGILSKYTNEVLHSDIRNIQIRQTFFQRIFGVGSIAIASAGHGDIEIQVRGIPNPGEVKNIIDARRRRRA